MERGYGLRPSQQARNQRDQEEDHEHDEQDLGDLGGAGGDAGEAEDRRDDCDDEKRKCPAKHDRLLRNVGESKLPFSKIPMSKLHAERWTAARAVMVAGVCRIFRPLRSYPASTFLYRRV